MKTQAPTPSPDHTPERERLRVLHNPEAVHSAFYTTGDIYHRWQAARVTEYRSKRLIDLLFSTAGLILLMLCWPFVAAGIKLSSPGPVIYRQRRTGKNGQEFTCLKFRTMHQIKLSRLDGKPVVTRQNDKRIFPFGRWLRKSNLDELPQMINVFRGDMSLVGPRPYPVEECKYWNNVFRDYYYRYSIKPGLTGYAQVNGLRGGTLNKEHMRNRLDHDLVYLEQQSLKSDLSIIWRTTLQMLHLDNEGH